MSNANLGWSVNDKEVLKSFQKMQGELDKQKQKIVQLEGASKKTNDVWAAGLRVVSAEQKRVMQGQDAFKAGLDKIAAANKSVADTQRSNALTALRGMTQTKAAADSWSQSLLQVGMNTSAVGLATATLAATVAVIIQRYNDWTQQVTELGQAQAEVNRIMQAATFAGKQPALVESSLKSIRGVSDADAATIFEAVKQKAPSESVERQLEITRAASKQAAIGVPVDKVSTFAGAMADMAGKMPGKSLDTIADTTTNLQQLMGDKFPEVSSDTFKRTIGELTSSGVSPETATALTAMGRNADLSAKTIEQLALKLPQVRGGTAEEKLTRLLSDDKLQKKILGKDFDVRLSTISPEQLAATRAQLTKGGTFAQSLVPQTEAAAKTMAEQFTKEMSKESGIQRERGDIGFARERLREFYEGAGLPKWQIEGAQVPFTGQKLGGKLQTFDAVIGRGIDPEQAVIAQIRAELKNAGVPTTEQAREAQKNALRLIEIMEKIEANQRKAGTKNINANVE